MVLFRSIFLDSNPLLVFTTHNSNNGWLDMGSAECKNAVISWATAATEGQPVKIQLYHADFIFSAVLSKNNCTFAGRERKRGFAAQNTCIFAGSRWIRVRIAPETLAFGWSGRAIRTAHPLFFPLARLWTFHGHIPLHFPRFCRRKRG
jgi:hypothetical protein